MYEVAITGFGIVSTLGTGSDKVSESLEKGRSGVSLDEKRKDVGFRSSLTGLIDDFIPPKLGRKQRKTMPEFVLWAYAAVLETLEKCGWNEEMLHSPATGLIIGNDSTVLPIIESIDIVREEKSTLNIGAARIFQSLNSTASMNLNTLLGNLGASWTLSGACASGGHAIGQAGDLIAMGRQERIICGGAQEINWQSVCSFDATNAFSLGMQNPAAASKPFDSERDGLVPSGGAAIVALERYDLAQKRGAKIYGKLASYAFSADGSKLSVPTGEGLGRAMQECLKRAKVNPEDIDYISAHATSTPLGDKAEAAAINTIFGAKGPWTSSTKSMTGHEMWMAGAAQAVYSLLMHQGGFLAPNINFTKQEEDAPPININAETIEKKTELILLNSAGFGGTNSCLVLDFRDC